MCNLTRNPQTAISGQLLGAAHNPSQSIQVFPFHETQLYPSNHCFESPALSIVDQGSNGRSRPTQYCPDCLPLIEVMATTLFAPLQGAWGASCGIPHIGYGGPKSVAQKSGPEKALGFG